VLGDVGGGAAVFAAERQALQQAQRHEEDRRGHADGLVRGQDADQERRGAHDEDGDEEGILAADEVADAPEHERAERPDQEAGGIRRERRQQRRRGVAFREEQAGEERRQRGIEIEVVPLEDGPERRREDDPPDLWSRDFQIVAHEEPPCANPVPVVTIE
jgi:hypothetical protein